MKISVSVAVLLLTCFSFNSCSKKYTCHCVYKTNNSVAYEEDSKIEGKKDYAEDKCDENDFSTPVTVGDSTYLSTAECDLKNK